MTTIKQGRNVTVENKERKFGSSDSYEAIWVEGANGKSEQCLLFTKDEIEKAKVRAQRNPEDLTKKSFLQNFID